MCSGTINGGRPESLHKYKGLVQNMLLTFQSSSQVEEDVDEEARKMIEKNFGSSS